MLVNIKAVGTHAAGISVTAVLTREGIVLIRENPVTTGMSRILLFQFVCIGSVFLVLG